MRFGFHLKYLKKFKDNEPLCDSYICSDLPESQCVKVDNLEEPSQKYTMQSCAKENEYCPWEDKLPLNTTLTCQKKKNEKLLRYYYKY